jgi:hypothetical protein
MAYWQPFADPVFLRPVRSFALSSAAPSYRVESASRRTGVRGYAVGIREGWLEAHSRLGGLLGNSLALRRVLFSVLGRSRALA